MLANLLARRQLLQFAQTKTVELQLYKPNMEKYFGRDFTQVEKEIQLITRKYSLGKKGVETLFKIQPKVFIAGSQQRTDVEDMIKFLNKLEETEPIALIINELMFDSRHLLLTMTPDDILTFINHLKAFGFDQNSTVSILNGNGNLIHKNFDVIYNEKLSIFQDYLHMTKEEVLELIVLEPFLLTCSSSKLRESVIFFVEKEKVGVTRKDTLKLLRELGEVFLMGREQLTLLTRWLKNWGLGRKELWRILLANPLLLLNHPGEVFHYKAKMLRQFRFTSTMGQTLLQKHPSALICSVRALEAKFLVARDRLNIKLDETNLEYLTFKFGANIRPRTQMLIRGKIPYTSENVVEFFKCSQKEFLLKTGIPAAKYYEEKNKFSITAELDFPKKRCLKNYPGEDKIIEFSKKYYPNKDLIITKR